MRPLVITYLVLSLSACGVSQTAPSEDTSVSKIETRRSGTMEISLNNERFYVRLEDSPAAKEILDVFPKSFTMRDLHQNEKYYEMRQPLNVQAESIGTIQAGDVMLYGNNTVVIFYQSFKTSYSYTRIGRIENVTHLKKTLSEGDVDVKIKKEE